MDVKKSQKPQDYHDYSIGVNLLVLAKMSMTSLPRSHKQIGKFLNAMRKSKAIDVTEKKGVIHVSKVVGSRVQRLGRFVS